MLVQEQVATYNTLVDGARNAQEKWDEVVLRGARELEMARLRWIRRIIENL